MKPIHATASIQLTQPKTQELRPSKHTLSEQEREKVKLKKATHEFESFFMSSMLKSMRQTIPKGEESDGIGGSGLGKDIYQSMFDEELSRKMADGSHGGLADILYRNLVKRIEAKYSKPPDRQVSEASGAKPTLKEVKQVPTQE